MKMEQSQIFKLLALLLSSAFVCGPLYGEVSAQTKPQDTKPSDTKPKEAKPAHTKSEKLPPISSVDTEGDTALCPPESPEEQCTISLQETLERAYMQNAQLDAARAGLRATDESVSQANADWRPSLSVEGSQSFENHYPINKGINNTKNNSNALQYTASISQNVYKGGATVANIGQAESKDFAERAGLFSTEQQTLLNAVQAHTAIVASQAIYGYQQDKLRFNKQFLARTKARYEVGELGRTDVAASEAEYEGSLAELTTALANLEIAKATYLHQIGSPPGKPASANIILEIPKCYEEALTVAKVQNPIITQAKYQLEAAEYVVDLKLAGLLPTVDVQASTGNDRRGGTGLHNPNHPKRTNFAFSATVGVPIYAQGIPNSQVRQAYQLVAQQKINLVEAQRQVVENVRTAWENLVAAQKNVKSRIVEVKARKLAVEGAVEESNVGVKSVIEVLLEEQKLVESQISLAQAQQTLVNSSYQVLQAMGRLTACDLRLRVKYYDPNAYYNEYKDAWIQFWQDEDLRYVKDGIP